MGLMTDLEKLRELLNGWGVPFVEEVDGDFISVVHGKSPLGMHLPESDKVVGYKGFHTEYYFRADGSFETVGSWE